MNHKPNLFNVMLSVLIGLTLLLSAAQPNLVAASSQTGQGDGIRRSIHPQTGKLNFLGADPSNPIRLEAAMQDGLSLEMRGNLILEIYGREFGLTNPTEELRFLSSHETDGRGTVRYQQVYQDIPVMAGELIVNTNEVGALLSINGEVSPELRISTIATLDSLRATAVALREIASAYGLNFGELRVSTPELWIYDARLMNGKDTTPAHLVWRMEVTSENAPLRELVLVNTQTGKISLHFNQIDTAWRGNASISTIHQVDRTLILPEVAYGNEEAQIARPLNGEPLNPPSLPDQAVRAETGTLLYVSTTGSDDVSNNCQSNATPCLTIQNAVNKANDGDVIRVATGIYQTSGFVDLGLPYPYTVVSLGTANTINPGLIDITLSGGWNEGFTNQEGYAIIDGYNPNMSWFTNAGIRISYNGDIPSAQPDVKIDHFIVRATSHAIKLESSKLTLTNSAVTNNGSGIYATKDLSSNPPSLVTLSNVTLDRNSIGISAWQGAILNINNTTITKNGSSTSTAGGIYIDKDTTVHLKNSILAQNGGAIGRDCYVATNSVINNFPTLENNLIGNTTGCSIPILGGNLYNTSPGLSVYSESGGYYVYLGASPILNAGKPATCTAYDQRGVSRFSDGDTACDMGAIERQSPPGPVAYLAILGGSNQMVTPGDPFPQPFKVVVLDSDYDPIPGVTVTFSAPSDPAVAGGTFTDGNTSIKVVSNSGGIAQSPLFTANLQRGAYLVSAEAEGVTGVNFNLENLIWFVSPTGDDSNSCKEPALPCATVNAAVEKAQVGGSIYLAEGRYFPSGNKHANIDHRVKIVGGWASDFSGRGGPTILDGQGISTGLANSSLGTLIQRVHIENCSLGLSNSGSITLDQVSISGCSFTAIIQDNLDSIPIMTILNSTISGNQEGGLDIIYGNVTIKNSTITGNKRRQPSDQGGGIKNWGPGNVTLSNSIVADNQASSGPDCSTFPTAGGKIISLGYNIIGNTTGCTITAKAGDLFNVDPQLSPYIPLGYHPLPSSSPAIGRGNPATCTNQDQRGVERLANSKCDIGAYEYRTPGSAVGLLAVNPLVRRTPIHEPFGASLQAVAVDIFGSPVGGVPMNFAAPATGPSGLFPLGGTSESQTTDNNGYATSSAFTANGEYGDYLVTAESTALGTVTYQMHNGAWLVKPVGGNDNYDCLSIATACRSIDGVILKTSFNSGETVWVAAGNAGAGLAGAHYIKKDMVFVGGWDPTFTTKGGASKISAWYSNGADLTLRNFVLYVGIENAGRLVMENVSLINTDGRVRNGYESTLILSNVTVTGNGPLDAPIYNSGGTVYVFNSTITKNKGRWAGGIYNDPYSDGVIYLKDTILAGNVATMATEKKTNDCLGKFVSLGHNIIGTTGIIQGGFDECQGQWMDTDIVGDNAHPYPSSSVIITTLKQDPLSGQWYFPLKFGGPAIDGGNEALPGGGGNACPATDQLGTLRPQGARCDIGAVEYRFGIYPTTSLLVTYNAGSNTTLPGTKACEGNNATCSSGDLKVKNAHKYAFSAYSQYKTWHKRNSIDDKGLQIISAVHYGSNFNDAFWNGFMLVYGDGANFASADDIVGHEYTHGVTQYESNLFSWYQSGAISESFSDLWGEAIDQANRLGNDAASVKWLIGEDLGGTGAVRNMADPPAFKHPDSMTNPYYCKSGTCLDDNGGIHINSGINNKAAYLLVNGGTFNGRTVTSLGWTKTLAIYYEAQTNLLSSGADYLDLYNALYQACLNKVGINGIGSADCQEVRDATTAVKMNLSPDSTFNPDTPYCPTGSVRAVPDLFFDDFETGSDGWDFGNIKGQPAWTLSAANAGGGSASLWADDGYAKTDSYAATQAITLPAGSKPYLHFTHAFNFETSGVSYYDGGVLEYSVNNGLTWVDVKSLFSAGQNYKGFIMAGFGNPIQGRSAFVGQSHGYVDSRYNLTTLAGKTIRFRWRLGTDSADNLSGWFVDEVRIYRCVAR
jgi:Zn-dependent metalloprotease